MEIVRPCFVILAMAVLCSGVNPECQLVMAARKRDVCAYSSSKSGRNGLEIELRKLEDQIKESEPSDTPGSREPSRSSGALNIVKGLVQASARLLAAPFCVVLRGLRRTAPRSHEAGSQTGCTAHGTARATVKQSGSNLDSERTGHPMTIR